MPLKPLLQADPPAHPPRRLSLDRRPAGCQSYWPDLGLWPGLAASCAIILLPDAHLQGSATRYLSLSSDFLQQVNLADLSGCRVPPRLDFHIKWPQIERVRSIIDG